MAGKRETTGLVDQVEPFIGSSGLRVWYVYRNATGKTFRSSYQLFVDSRYQSTIEPLLKGKNMPVIYDSANVENSRLLLYSDDFKRYGIQQPDSLWKLNDIIAKLKF
jgi:hypothetical protein